MRPVDWLEKHRRKLFEVIEKNKSQSAYDVIVSYSGGKDSSYTLKLLKQNYGLTILAVTFDHGFMSYQALRNSQTVTRSLNVDHLIIRPAEEKMRRAFVKSMRLDLYSRKALEKASSICLSCMHMIKSLMLKCAIEMRIPLIAYGWSPGQVSPRSAVVPLNAPLIREMQKSVVKILDLLLGKDLRAFVPNEKLFDMFYEKEGRDEGGSLFSVHPLAVVEYNEEHVLNEIADLGWEAPGDTDPNSSNCLLNSFANWVHIDRYGFHPYAYEIAGLVREGWLDRERGLEKLAVPAKDEIVELVGRKLGINP